MMAIKSRAERRERRRRILQAAVRLAHALFPEDEGQRREFLASTIAAHLNIPGLSEKGEARAIATVIELIEDLID